MAWHTAMCKGDTLALLQFLQKLLEKNQSGEDMDDTQ